MKLLIAIIFFLSFVFLNKVNAQAYVDFNLEYSNLKITNSLYSQVEIIDTRNKKKSMGVVRKGMLNEEKYVVPKIPIVEQISKMFYNVLDKPIENNKLIIVLRELRIREAMGFSSETGFIQFKANIFSKVNNEYFEVLAIDTVAKVKALDVTKKLMNNISEVVSSSIFNAMVTKANTNNAYVYDNMYNLDSIDKTKIPLYANTSLADGVYSSYNFFKNQKPDKEKIIYVEMEKEIPSYVEVSEQGKKVTINTNINYALVYQGKPYVSCKGQWVPLYKVGNDFVFTGYLDLGMDQEAVVLGAMVFGIAGAAIASSIHDYEYCEAKIEYQSGAFIKIKKAEKNKK